MAVLDHLKGLNVKVIILDELKHFRPLEEFIDEELKSDNFSSQAAEITVSRFIEATTGAKFGINFDMTNAFEFTSPAISFAVFLDDILLRQPLARKSVFEEKGSWATSIFSVQHHEISGSVPISTQQYFRFSEIVKTSGEEKLATVDEDAAAMSRVGQIVIKVFRRTEGMLQNIKNPKDEMNRIPEAVHESALKGSDLKTHAISLGEAERAGKVYKYWDSKFIDGEDKPIGVFQFKYRSRDMLKSMMVIPRNPEPENDFAIRRIPANTTTAVPEHPFCNSSGASLQSVNAKFEVAAAELLSRCTQDNGYRVVDNQTAIDRLISTQESDLNKFIAEQKAVLEKIINASTKPKCNEPGSSSASIDLKELRINDKEQAVDMNAPGGVKRQRDSRYTREGLTGIKRRKVTEIKEVIDLTFD